MRHIATLGLAEARLAIEAIRAEFERMGKYGTAAVADCHGELVAFERHDEVSYSTSLIACNKAWTAAREGTGTREIGQAARDETNGFDFAYFGDRRYVGWGGGLPVRFNGRVIGAVAVSGLTEAEDAAVAQRGVDAILGLSAAVSS